MPTLGNIRWYSHVAAPDIFLSAETVEQLVEAYNETAQIYTGAIEKLGALCNSSEHTLVVDEQDISQKCVELYERMSSEEDMIYEIQAKIQNEGNQHRKDEAEELMQRLEEEKEKRNLRLYQEKAKFNSDAGSYDYEIIGPEGNTVGHLYAKYIGIQSIGDERLSSGDYDSHALVNAEDGWTTVYDSWRSRIHRMVDEYNEFIETYYDDGKRLLEECNQLPIVVNSTQFRNDMSPTPYTPIEDEESDPRLDNALGEERLDGRRESTEESPSEPPETEQTSETPADEEESSKDKTPEGENSEDGEKSPEVETPPAGESPEDGEETPVGESPEGKNPEDGEGSSGGGTPPADGTQENKNSEGAGVLPVDEVKDEDIEHNDTDEGETTEIKVKTVKKMPEKWTAGESQIEVTNEDGTKSYYTFAGTLPINAGYNSKYIDYYYDSDNNMYRIDNNGNLVALNGTRYDTWEKANKDKIYTMVNVPISEKTKISIPENGRVGYKVDTTKAVEIGSTRDLTTFKNTFNYDKYTVISVKEGCKIQNDFQYLPEGMYIYNPEKEIFSRITDEGIWYNESDNEGFWLTKGAMQSYNARVTYNKAPENFQNRAQYADNISFVKGSGK